MAYKTADNPAQSQLAGQQPPMNDEAKTSLRNSRLFWPMSGLAVVLGLMLLTALAYINELIGPDILVALAFILTFCGAGIIGLCMHRMRSNLLEPLADMRQWATRMRAGDMDASLPQPHDGEFAPLVTDLSCLCDEFKRLKSDLDAQVSKQTERLAQKNASLKILYDVAASINQSGSLDELLLRFLRILKQMVGAKAATVRLLHGDGKARLVGSIGVDDEEVKLGSHMPVKLCRCGTALAEGDILCEKDPEACSKDMGRQMYGPDEVEMISVPLEYQSRILGTYNLFVDKSDVAEREDILELLTSIGSHLGMAVEKARLDDEAKGMSIIEERTTFANELHDSLAQTLASLRFQVKILDEIVGDSVCDDGTRQILQIKNSIDEAHTELRGLIAQFRAPLENRDLAEAVRRVVDRFREQTGITVFFQEEYEWTNLPIDRQMQVVRIAQECLANVRKHAQAQFVRVLLRASPGELGLILVEDDGVGFRTGQMDGHPGEHVGLSIMQERAHRLGGEFRLESEPGEGTRVELTFSHPGSVKNLEG